MNLAILTSSFPANSGDARATAGLFVKDFAIALHEAGHSVTVIVPQKHTAPKEPISGIPVIWFPWLGGKKRLSYMSPFNPFDAIAMVSLLEQGYRHLLSLHNQHKFDHVIAMWAVPAGLLAIRLKKHAGVPCTTWCLGSDIWTYGRLPLLKNIVSHVLKQSDYIFADGIVLGNDAQKLAGRACPFLSSSRKLKPLHNTALTANHTGIRFLFIGRYASVKGVDVLLDAMARFISSGHNGTLFMFGGGPLSVSLQKRAAQPDLHNHVVVGEYADTDTVVSQLTMCDVVIIPSRNESIPVVLSDALQMNKPVIVTDVGDMGTLVSQSKAGLVVPAEDAPMLCQAMIDMATMDRSTLAPGIMHLSAQFDIANSAKKLSEIITTTDTAVQK